MANKNVQKGANSRKSVLFRLIRMLFSFYPVLLPITLLCILLNAIISSIPSIFMQNIIAAVEQSWQTGDWAAVSGHILGLVAILAIFYGLSLLAGVAYTQLMAIITQGSLAKLREKMFNSMQDLPIRYFDTHNHGDVMSYYTNDIDTLRQMISQSIPQLIISSVVVLTVLCIMLYYSLWMTLVILLGVFCMFLVVRKIGGNSARYFIRQQQAIGRTEGYVTLVNAKEKADGTLEECEERTNVWAWKHPHNDGTVTYTRLAGDVRMYDVDFGYTPEKTVLHGVSLYAKPGQKVAFVGSTGAGKTTITNLINRFYDIADGKIRYDGININKIKKADLRRSLGMVLQDTNLFTGTVMENIRYGRLDATDEECMAAAELAGAHDFITRLPQGYDTPLSGNGASLSQGQRQLLSIARAAVADPPVMILDEATSSIDTRTEAIVQRGMDALMTNRTVFVIAHRLSTVQNSNAIMVLDHGRIIERGTHDELIALKGTYYQLYTGALELD